MPITINKIVTLYPKETEELHSPINERPPVTALQPPTPDRVIISDDTAEAALTYSEITGNELNSLSGIQGNIEERLNALEGKTQAIGFSQSWYALAVSPNGETEPVFQYIVPAGKKFVIEKVSYIARADSICRLRVDSTVIEYLQTSWTMRSDEKVFPSGHLCNEGEIVKITIQNLGEAAADFYGSIHGYLIEI